MAGEAAPTIARSVAATLRRLTASLPGDSAALDAQLLLSAALDRPRSWLFAHGDASLPADAAARLESLATRRRRGEPVAYLLGEREFWDVTLAVTPAVLVPRPETELLVETAIAVLQAVPAPRVLDLGTGSGAIAIAVARARADAHITAVERSVTALSVARHNARRLVPGRIDFVAGDWLQPVHGHRFDAVLANPPYIAEDDPHLRRGDVAHEPREALAAGADGLDDLRRIAAEVSTVLAPGGVVALEHGFDQGDAVRGLLRAARLTEVRSLRDLAGHERVSMARGA
jgi:release factor glutamine methyltransferase